MTRTFIIPYRESVFYSYAEITALSDIVFFVSSSWLVAFVQIFRSSVARLNVRETVVFLCRVILPN
jgi:hypothetical protein